MSLIAATQLTAVATTILAAFAIVTAVFAILAFRKQSAEVATLQRQATDQQELTRQQGELLKVQSSQLNLQRQQLDDQRKVDEKQIPVLELQAAEFRESIDERKQDREQRRRSLAALVFVREEFHPAGSGLPGPAGAVVAQEAREQGIRGTVSVGVINDSNQPVYDLEIGWHKGTAPWDQPEHRRQLLPGDSAQFSRTLPPRLPAKVSTDLFGANVRFRDAAGITWLRRPDGELTEEA